MTQEKKVYLFGVDKEKPVFVSGISALKKLAEIHRREMVDALFVKSSIYSVLEDYCRDNDVAPIELHETGTSIPTDNFLYVFGYAEKHPQKNRFGQVAGEGDLEQLVELFKSARFLTERVDI